jgi:hypothetical protein
MPLLAKAFLMLMKTRSGRKLFFAVSLGVLELARSERAHKLYAEAAKDARGVTRAVRRRR